jgi:glycerophosphoryl diester phosphodiesterase
MIDGKFFAGDRPRNIAHRGASGTVPENTMAAFGRAVLVGADIIELDVRLTADGAIPVCHDAVVDRVTNGTGPVNRMTYGDLRRLNAGYRFTLDGGASYPFRDSGLYIPLLEEVLEAWPNMPLNIELKSSEPQLAQKLQQLLQRFGRLHDGSVLVSSFNHRALKRMRQQAPSLVTGSSRVEMWQLLLASGLRLPWLCRAKGASFQLPVRKLGIKTTNPKAVATAHRRGLEVHTYTVDDEQQMHRLLDMGVDGLFTNFPERLARVISTRRSQ